MFRDRPHGETATHAGTATPLVLTLGLCLLLAGGCADSATQPEAETPAPARGSATEWVRTTSQVLDPTLPASARTSGLGSIAESVGDLEDLVASLFPAPGLSRAASVRVRNIHRDLDRGNAESALAKALAFREFTLKRLDRGQLADPNGDEAPTIEQAVAQLLNGIFEAVGLPGGQAVGLTRITYGSALIDDVAPEAFPRGGFYEAVVAGDGVEGASGVLFDDPRVFGFVSGSPGPGLITVLLGSSAVEQGRPDLAPIPDVPFQLTTDLGGGAPLAIGGGTLDIVPGPAPVASNLRIVGPITSLPRGQSTSIDFSLDIASAGNIRFYFVGCALCTVEFRGTTGDRFDQQLSVTVTWDVPADYPFPDFGVGIGAVSSADLEGRAGLSIPVVDP